MKKYLLLIVLLVTTLCLSACDCGGKKLKYETYRCTEYYITKSTNKIDIKQGYKNLELIFYNDGNFKWVGETTDGLEEIYEGTYRNDWITSTNDDGEEVRTGYQLTLYYDNNPTEPTSYGNIVYVGSFDGTLTRKHYQVTPTYQQIVEQKFELVD